MFGWFKNRKKADEPVARVKTHVMTDLALEDLAIQDNDVVLQVGFGLDLEPMIRIVMQLDKGRFAGLESNPSLREAAIRVFAEEFSSFKADFKDGVASKIPFYDGSFTKVLSLDQMHSWVNIDKTLDEINRVLAAGGRFVLVWSQPIDGDTNVGRMIVSPEQMQQHLRAAGFHRLQFRERVDLGLRYYQYSSDKP